MKRLLTDSWLSFRRGGWVWANAIIILLIYFIFLFSIENTTGNLIVVVPITVMVSGFFIAVPRVIHELSVTKLSSYKNEEQLKWIDEHCLFYFIHNNYSVWIPRKSTRMAFKLRWDE